MTAQLNLLKAQYQELLHGLSTPGRKPTLAQARAFGTQATMQGLPMMELALLHEQILVDDLLPGTTPSRQRVIIRSSGKIFSAAVTAAEKATPPQGPRPRHLPTVLTSLDRRATELAALSVSLAQETKQRKKAEALLTICEARHQTMMDESQQVQKQLRKLSQRLLTAQEEERREISRELHDVVGQTLAGITIHLATLKQEARVNTASLNRHIALTQRLVRKSVNIVHRFARNLRPAVLDDLGLAPALESHIQSIDRLSRIKTHIEVDSETDGIDSLRRIILFRVAQEALGNVLRHAHAHAIELHIVHKGTTIRMTIHDDGRGFDVASLTGARCSKRLGIVGMRERLEMIGGKLSFTSDPESGTTVTATIPSGQGRKTTTASKASSDDFIPPTQRL